jgi:hypothetical protein
MVPLIVKDWRPDDWDNIRHELTKTPDVWSPSGPNKPHIEQIIEATASRILMEFDKYAHGDGKINKPQ